MTAGVRRQVAAFIAVGAVGFAVDGGILTLLSRSFGVNLYAARACSFLCATLVTWLLNRRHVFGAGTDSPRGAAGSREYLRYFTVQTGGAGLNLAVFSVLVATVPALRPWPVLPLAAGAAFGMVFNFLGARFWVFRPTPQDAEHVRIYRHR